MTLPVIVTAIVADGNIIPGDPGSRPVPWWSYAKTVLAAAALVLVRDGKLLLDTPLAGKPYTRGNCFAIRPARQTTAISKRIQARLKQTRKCELQCSRHLGDKN